MTKPKTITHLKLPLQFNVQLLQADLNSLLRANWKPHFNDDVYDGKWNIIPLYAFGGDPTNIFSHNIQNQELKPTPILESCTYLKKVIKQFKCPLLSVRLLRLEPNSHIKAHKDHELGYENDCFRLHIPILSNPDVLFYLDGENLKMREGECWYTNVNFTHSVSNNGTTDRVHLVIDGERNEWSDQLFFSITPKESLIPPKQESHDPELLKRIIENLEYLQPPNYQDLVTELRKQLSNIEN